MKEEAYMKKIGISVYDPSQAEKLAKYISQNTIAFNAFDKGGQLGPKRLKMKGLKFMRSIFLQGLLLMNIKDINKYFTPGCRNKSWHEYCFTNRLTLLEGAIANAMREENIISS